MGFRTAVFVPCSTVSLTGAYPRFSAYVIKSMGISVAFCVSFDKCVVNTAVGVIVEILSFINYIIVYDLYFL